MKANEFMLDDWVIAPSGNPIRVYSLGKNGIGLGVAHTYRNLQPIPITPEILEKNGFALVEVGDNGPATPKKNYNRYERWECKTMWIDISIWFDRIIKKWCLHGLNSVNISYVHELQHAFKFCKIEKEIVL